MPSPERGRVKSGAWEPTGALRLSLIGVIVPSG